MVVGETQTQQICSTPPNTVPTSTSKVKLSWYSAWEVQRLEFSGPWPRTIPALDNGNGPRVRSIPKYFICPNKPPPAVWLEIRWEFTCDRWPSIPTGSALSEMLARRPALEHLRLIFDDAQSSPLATTGVTTLVCWPSLSAHFRPPVTAQRLEELLVKREGAFIDGYHDEDSRQYIWRPVYTSYA